MPIDFVAKVLWFVEASETNIFFSTTP